MLEKLMANPYAWAIISFIAIASFIYAIVCQHKNKEKKEFSYRQQSSSLIVKKKSKYENLSITYDGKEIEDLTVSKFVIWNSGNKTLAKEDMVSTKELTVSTKESQIILDAELIARTEDTNRFLLRVIDEHTVKIYFDYADKNDGIVLQIIHTGTKEDIVLDCKIKGGNPIKNTASQKSIKEKHKMLLVGLTMLYMVFATLLMFVVAILYSIAIFNPAVQKFLFETMNHVIPEQQNSIIMTIICWLYSLTIGRFLYLHFKKAFHFGIPKPLKEYLTFEEDD